jgi:hypothetical protein
MMLVSGRQKLEQALLVVLLFFSGATAAPNVYQANVHDARWVLTTITVEDYVAGSIRVRLTGTSYGTSRSANGTYTELLYSDGSWDNIAIQGAANFQGKVTWFSQIPVAYGGSPDLVTDGGFDAVTEGGELATPFDLTAWPTAVNATVNDADTFTVNVSGGYIAKTYLTVGNAYKMRIAGTAAAGITTFRVSNGITGNYITGLSGSFDETFYFNAVGINLILAGDGTGQIDISALELKQVTATHWTAGTGWAPEASAGALTGKALKMPGTASYLQQTVGLVANHMNSVAFTVSGRSAGGISSQPGGSTTPEWLYGNASVVNYQDSVDATNGVLYLYADSSFNGVIDSVSTYDLGPIRESEAGYPYWTLPTGVFDDKGTLVVKWTPGFGEAEPSGASNYGLISAGADQFSVLYHNNGTLKSFDGAGNPVKSTTWTANTEYTIAIKWGYGSPKKFRVGVVSGGAVSWGTEQNFDGSFTLGAALNVGYSLFGPMWIRLMAIWNGRILSDSDILRIERTDA